VALKRKSQRNRPLQRTNSKARDPDMRGFHGWWQGSNANMVLLAHLRLRAVEEVEPQVYFFRNVSHDRVASLGKRKEERQDGSLSQEQAVLCILTFGKI
jgi:hypothetical protein